MYFITALRNRWLHRLITAGLALAFVLPFQARAQTLSALTESLPPLNYEINGTVTGFSSDLLDLMAAEAGITVNKQLLPWARAMSMVSRQNNTLIYSLVRTPERESQFQWIGPISPRRIVLYKFSNRQDITIKRFEDLRAYRIGTTNESAATKQLLAKGLVIDGQGGAHSPGLDIGVNDEANMRKFIAKRFDLLLALDWAAAYQSRTVRLNPGEIEPAWVLDESLSYWYGLSLGSDSGIAKKLNAALKKIKDDGRYAQLKQRYMPKN